MSTIALAPAEFQRKDDTEHVTIDYDGTKYSVTRPLAAKKGYPFGGIYQAAFDPLYPGRYAVANGPGRLEDNLLRAKWDELARQLGVLRSGLAGLSPGEWLLVQLESGLQEYGGHKLYTGKTDINMAVSFFEGTPAEVSGQIVLDVNRIFKATPEIVADPPVWRGVYDSVTFPPPFDFDALTTVSTMLKREYASLGLDAEVVYAFLSGADAPSNEGPHGEPIVLLNEGRKGYRPFTNGKDASGGLGTWVIISGPATSGQDATHGLFGQDAKEDPINTQAPPAGTTPFNH